MIIIIIFSTLFFYRALAAVAVDQRYAEQMQLLYQGGQESVSERQPLAE